MLGGQIGMRMDYVSDFGEFFLVQYQRGHHANDCRYRHEHSRHQLYHFDSQCQTRRQNEPTSAEANLMYTQRVTNNIKIRFGYHSDVHHGDRLAPDQNQPDSHAALNTTGSSRTRHGDMFMAGLPAGAEYALVRPRCRPVRDAGCRRPDLEGRKTVRPKANVFDLASD